TKPPPRTLGSWEGAFLCFTGLSQNSPLTTPSLKASHSVWVKRSFGPSLSLESRTYTLSPSKATSTHAPLDVDRDDLRQVSPCCSIPLLPPACTRSSASATALRPGSSPIVPWSLRVPQGR